MRRKLFNRMGNDKRAMEGRPRRFSRLRAFAAGLMASTVLALAPGCKQEKPACPAECKVAKKKKKIKKLKECPPSPEVLVLKERLTAHAMSLIPRFSQLLKPEKNPRNKARYGPWVMVEVTVVFDSKGKPETHLVSSSCLDCRNPTDAENGATLALTPKMMGLKPITPTEEKRFWELDILDHRAILEGLKPKPKPFTRCRVTVKVGDLAYWTWASK